MLFLILSAKQKPLASVSLAPVLMPENAALYYSARWNINHLLYGSYAYERIALLTLAPANLRPIWFPQCRCVAHKCSSSEWLLQNVSICYVG